MPRAGIRYTDVVDYTNDSDWPPETVGAALDYCSRRLEAAGVCFGHGTDNPWDEAVQLVLAVAELPVDAGDGVLPHRMDPGAIARLGELLARRIEARVPLPYLLGRAWFAGLEFRCDERAIVPRSPIAELIVRDYAPWYTGPPPRRILDLCCGGGCIGLAAAHYGAQARVDLLDIDAGALALARENADALDLGERVRILTSNLFEALSGERYDLILCNPPYVDALELASMPTEYHAEPPRSLGAGADGLDIVRRVLAGAGEHLEPHGLLVLEVGLSWPALEAAYPKVPFTWVEFEHGGEGVCALTAREWQDYSACW